MDRYDHLYAADAERERPDFRMAFDKIIGRELTVETLTTYAAAALDDLVALVEAIVSEYRSDPAHQDRLTGTAHERAALMAAGLDGAMIERTLDHIAGIGESIHRLGTVISERTEYTDRVIIPPVHKAGGIIPGEGSASLQKEMLPKLETLLLILEQVAGVRIDDSSETRLLAGAVHPDMVRQATYYIVETPGINRVTFVCNESENATFVFDTAECREMGLTPERLSELNKEAMKEIIGNHPTCGDIIHYSKLYSSRLARALTEEFSGKTTEEKRLNLLKPKAPPAPEGVLSLKGIRTIYGVDRRALGEAVVACADTLGEVDEYQFGSITTLGYTRPQQEQLLNYMKLADRLPAEPAPKGVMSVDSMANKFGVHPKTISIAVAACTEGLSEERQYLFTSKKTRGFNEEDQKLIYQWLERNNHFIQKKQPGWMSMKEMTKAFRVGESTINLAISSLGIVPQIVKSHSAIGDSYTGPDCTRIKVWLSDNGYPKRKRRGSA